MNLPKPTRFFSKNQETKVAKSLGGKLQANSGATPFRKGDVITSEFLLECKTSTKEVKSFSIQKEVLEKMEEERFAMRKPFAAMAIDFGCAHEPCHYILSERSLKLLIQRGEQNADVSC